MIHFKQFMRVLLMIVAFISLAISIVILSGGLIYRGYLSFVDLATPVGLTKSQLLINIDHMMDFLIFPQVHTLNFPNFSSSAAGIQHFVEVKYLMQANFVLTICGLIFLGWNYQSTNKLGVKKLQYQLSKLAVYFPLLLLFLMVIAFEQIFLLFHQVFFRNDLWLFDPLVDPIILVLPENLFLIYFVSVIILYELLLAIYRRIMK